MLRLEDRIGVAIGVGMGIQLSADEVGKFASLLIAVRVLEDSKKYAVCSREQTLVINNARKLFA